MNVWMHWKNMKRKRYSWKKIGSNAHKRLSIIKIDGSRMQLSYHRNFDYQVMIRKSVRTLKYNLELHSERRT